MDYVGLALFSVVGTQVAGDAGFNIIGCTLVGCVAGLGGRTINNILYGTSSLVTKMPGVFWARNPMYLAVAIGSSLVTFFAWPLYCEKMSLYYLETVIGKDKLEKDGSVGKEAFLAACERDHDFLKTIHHSVQRILPKSTTHMQKLPNSSDLFHHIDLDNSGTIDSNELSLLVQDHVRNSYVIYAVDTVALAAISVAGKELSCFVVSCLLMYKIHSSFPVQVCIAQFQLAWHHWWLPHLG